MFIAAGMVEQAFHVRQPRFLKQRTIGKIFYGSWYASSSYISYSFFGFSSIFKRLKIIIGAWKTIQRTELKVGRPMHIFRLVGLTLVY